MMVVLRVAVAFLLSILFLYSGNCQDATLFDELAVIYPDTEGESGRQRIMVDVPCDALAGIHVLVSGFPAGESVHWQLLHDNKVVDDLRGYRMIAVPVEQNTGLTSRTEIWEKKKNPHVVRRAPFEVFEVLEPSGFTIQASEKGVVALRIEVLVPHDAEAGRKSFALELEAGEWRKTLHWDLVIHSVNVPRPGKESPGYTNWFSTALIAERHGLKIWSEPFFEMLASYADLMMRGRQNCFWICWKDFVTVSDQGRITLDIDRMKRYVGIFLDRGFTRVEGGHVARRHKDDWASPRLDLTLTKSDAGSEKGRAELADLFKAINAALDETGLLDKAQYLQHLSDEPTDTNAESYKALAEQVRAHMPGVKIFEATMSRALVDAVDHWCPQVQKFQQNQAFFEERRAAGDRVWVYTCLVPGGPWLNRLLDQERLRPVYLGWSLVKYDLEGFLHWGLNHYRKDVDPFITSVVPHGDGAPNFLPAGDSHVVYPGKNGPLSGQRFEAHRIGMEDAELLRRLATHDPEGAQALIRSVFRAFDDYETDIEAYRAAKKKLLLTLAGPGEVSESEPSNQQ